MTKSILHTIFLILLTIDIFCQQEEEDAFLSQFRDRIEYYKPQIDTVASLESITCVDWRSGRKEKANGINILDTLNQFSYFVLEANCNKHQYNLIALKRDNLFITFPIFEDSSGVGEQFWANDGFFELTTHNIFIGNGNKLLIKFKHNYGGTSVKNETTGFEIWDLDKIIRLAHFIDFYDCQIVGDSQLWEEYFQNYHYAFKNQSIIFAEYDKNGKRLTKTMNYSLTTNGLIKEK